MTYYHGKLPDEVFVVEDDGSRKPLEHHVKHSPTGFSWGYGGSGPSELARCLLIDALGDDATCKTCKGSGWLKEGPARNSEVPALMPEDREIAWNCPDCEDGCAVVPSMYQDFKWQVIAKLTQDADWTLTHQDILSWVALSNRATENL